MGGPHAAPAVLAAGLAVLVTGCGGRDGSPVPEAARRVVVAEAPHGSAMAAALVFPGSGWELPGTEGLTLVAARTLLETARRPLAALAARAEVTCGRGMFTFTLVAPPETWGPALDTLLEALFRPAPDRAALDSARAALHRSLSLDQASPAWQARLAARQALHGDTLGHASWQAPACGIPETLPLFDLADVRAGAYRFAPRMARLALLVPSGADSVARAIQARLPATAPPPLPAPTRTAPGRRYLERNTITAWTAHAFPFEPGADVEALHALGALLEHQLGPGVDRPDVLTVSYELEQHARGGSFIVYMVTRPEAAAEYALRLREELAAAGGRGASRSEWERVARRHRGQRLLEHELPETRAAAMARALALGLAPGDGWPDVGSTTLERVHAAAAALGAPGVAVVGPHSARAALTP